MTTEATAQEQQPLVHLTFTGVYAGRPYCGTNERTGKEVHGVYAPLHLEGFRAKCCPMCLKVYAGSYTNEQGALDPRENPPMWVQQALGQYV